MRSLGFAEDLGTLGISEDKIRNNVERVIKVSKGVF